MTTIVWSPTILPGGTSTLIQVGYTFNSNALDLALLGLYYVEVRNAVTGGILPNSAFSIFVVPANKLAAATWDSAGRRFTLPQGAQAPFSIKTQITPDPNESPLLDLTTITAVSWVVTLPGS